MAGSNMLKSIIKLKGLVYKSIQISEEVGLMSADVGPDETRKWFAIEVPVTI